MSFFKSSIIAVALALSMSPAQAALVTSLDITVNGTDYIAVFHDFDQRLSFNDVWDQNKDGVFGDGITPAFDKEPTFWTDAAGAASARDTLISALGTESWVDTSFNISDTFYIPSRSTPPTYLYVYGDLYDDPPMDFPFRSGPGSRDEPIADVAAWVTFTPVPAPTALALLPGGLLAIWAVHRRKVPVRGSRARWRSPPEAT